MRYVIFGAGRVGANIAAYLRYLGHDVDVIMRRTAMTDKGACREIINGADVIAAAIPDSVIAEWYAEWSDVIGDRHAIHFSGASDVDGMVALHPLYSFPRSLVDMRAMEQIGFACSEPGAAFEELIPGAPNPNFVLRTQDRAFYHALAVVTGNLPAFVWNTATPCVESLAAGSANDIMAVYLQSVVDRYRESPVDSLTGPIARHDANTVATNLSALENNPELKALYETFLRAAWPSYPD